MRRSPVIDLVLKKNHTLGSIIPQDWMNVDQATLQQQVFQYLDKNLDPSIKTQLSPVQVRELVRCFADWASAERLRCQFEIANNVAEAIQGKKKEVERFESEFLSDLAKL